MTAVIRAELQRATRRRTLLIGIAFALLFAAVATITVYSSVSTRLDPSDNGQGATLADLVASGGGTKAFAVGTSFGGFLVFVIFIGLMAREFSEGTFRALVLREPNRRRVIAGKVIGLLLFAAGIVALTEVASFLWSLALAPTQDISTSAWFSLDGLGAALGDFGTVMLGVVGWAVFGTTLAVIFRSAPVALAVGFAWAGPFENIVSDSWSTGNRVFPGRLLAAVINGGTTEVSFGRAVVTSLVYVAVAATVSLVLVSRRDVTA
jgi:ABC-type transport system involved in multi-copper enzyme maturation permease subunit